MKGVQQINDDGEKSADDDSSTWPTGVVWLMVRVFILLLLYGPNSLLTTRRPRSPFQTQARVTLFTLYENSQTQRPRQTTGWRAI